MKIGDTTTSTEPLYCEICDRNIAEAQRAAKHAPLSVICQECSDEHDRDLAEMAGAK